jgi:3-phosphoshikimate 1-carboxyvinyltransferase
MSLRLEKRNFQKTANIFLPSSKSITNRLLIINALLNNLDGVHNMSSSQDTQDLIAALQSDSEYIHVGDGGTTFRFALAYFFITNQEKIIEASPALQSRPHKTLFQTLEKLGAKFEFLNEVYQLPIKICKRVQLEILADELEVDVDKSSQFLSALLLISPFFKKEFKFFWKGNSVSSSYISMTLNLMCQHGIKLTKTSNSITIYHPSTYQKSSVKVEADWSSAAFFYALAAVQENQIEWVLIDLFKSGLQGDEMIADIMVDFGIETIDTKQGLLIRNGNKLNDKIEIDFINCPDLFPAIAICAAMRNLSLIGRHVQHLHYKESDRLKEITGFLQKHGSLVEIHKTEDGETVKIDSSNFRLEENSCVFSKHDHRLAMAYSLLSLKSNVIIDDETVVKKSFPDYWEVFDSISL